MQFFILSKKLIFENTYTIIILVSSNPIEQYGSFFNKLNKIKFFLCKYLTMIY